jgi:hypothetical protein
VVALPLSIIFSVSRLKINPAARAGFADGDLEDDLPELIDRISFVLPALWLNG